MGCDKQDACVTLISIPDALNSSVLDKIKKYDEQLTSIIRNMGFDDEPSPIITNELHTVDL